MNKLNQITLKYCIAYFSFIIFIIAISENTELYSQTNNKPNTPKPTTTTKTKPKFPDRYSPLDSPKAARIITDEMINNTMESARQSYIKALILMQKQDTTEAIIHFEASLSHLNKLASFPDIDTDSSYIELLEAVIIDYENAAKNREEMDLIISPKDRILQDDAITPDTTNIRKRILAADSSAMDFTRPPSADTSESYIFSIPHIDDLKIPFSENQAVEDQIALLTTGKLKAYMPR
jgi:hypothetical protein